MAIQRVKVDIRKIKADQDAIPAYKTMGAAGCDLIATTDKAICIRPRERALIPTGIAIALPKGYQAEIRPRSGLAAKHGVTVLNAPGTIDMDYRGEIKVILVNLGKKKYVIEPGERIAQMVIMPYVQAHFERVESLDDTKRGKGGFGHTGK